MAPVWVRFRSGFFHEKDFPQDIFCSSGVQIWQMCVAALTIRGLCHEIFDPLPLANE
jgi:hypothetical protein